MTYDSEADAAFIYLVDEIEPGEIAGEYSVVPDTAGENASLIIQRDTRKRVLGIEILGASRLLKPETIAAAEDITEPGTIWRPPE